ncbi:MAG: sigma-70 family RNA polymerase sigma factor [Eubacterium sp.]|nr:sigma-70 family RNA polymerase sigma factor [Eubacterium sp.]
MKNHDNSFITEHLALVHSVAAKFRGRGIEYDELYSAGLVGLVKAGNRFEPERGLQFSTYAVPVIMGEIKQLFRDSGTVKVSRPLKELSLKICRLRDEMLKNGEEPRLSDLADRLGVTCEQAALALSAAQPAVSLTVYDDDSEDAKQLDIAIEPPQLSSVEKIALRQSLQQLDADERRLIWLRYSENLTQSKTAELLGMTQVQVSRREKKILEKLRAQLIC